MSALLTTRVIKFINMLPMAYAKKLADIKIDLNLVSLTEKIVIKKTTFN